MLHPKNKQNHYLQNHINLNTSLVQTGEKGRLHAHAYDKPVMENL